jgi:hypothetical protein
VTLSGERMNSDRFGANDVHQHQNNRRGDTERVMTVLEERFGIVLRDRAAVSSQIHDGSSNSVVGPFI